ncbi:hypothetical protein [Fischerella thermalis]|uniref:hypothetical protein n=1 Tax=Fischerella thermalis TaxID=372787 RepID=UPI0002E18D3E|nr:hypothetical protein [Fischerella thermalis]
MARLYIGKRELLTVNSQEEIGNSSLPLSPFPTLPTVPTLRTLPNYGLRNK